VIHEPERAADYKKHDQQSESQRHELLVLSGPVVMCRKNTRCTPICAIASRLIATGMLGCQTRSVPATKKDVAVKKARRGRYVPIISSQCVRFSAQRARNSRR